LRNPRVLVFLLVWFGINLVFGVGAITFGGETQSIAWLRCLIQSRVLHNSLMPKAG